MRTLIMLALLAAQAMAQGVGNGNQTGEVPGAVSGSVSASGTGRPVTRAQVQLTGADGQNRMTESDGTGRFMFDDVVPGAYRVRASRDGYVAGEFGQIRPRQSGRVISIREGESQSDIVVRLVPTGVISGHLRDIYGEPVVNARIEALRFGYENGRRVLTPIRNTTTNDLGEYRLFWIEPGEYLVRAVAGNSPAPALALPGGNAMVFRSLDSAVRAVAPTAAPFIPAPQVPPPPPVNGTIANAGFIAFNTAAVFDESGTTQAPVYYAGTREPSQAITIPLAAGMEFSGADMTWADEMTAGISGRVTAGQSELPPGISVALTPRSELTLQGGGLRRIPVGPDGEFEISGVTPGTYDLTASIAPVFRSVQVVMGPDGTRNETIQNATNEPLFARTTVEVRSGGASIEGVIMELTPGFELTGRIRTPQGSPIEVSRLRVQLRGDRTIFGMPLEPAAVAADGTFAISDLPPGEYWVDVPGLPDDAYLAEARLGAQDALNAPFPVGPGVRGPLDMTIESDAAGADVLVLDPAGERAPGISVVLVPDPSRRERTESYYVAATDDGAIARFDGIPPGDYTVFAWADAPPGAWQNRDFLRPYEDQGIPLRLVPSGHAQIAANLIP